MWRLTQLLIIFLLEVLSLLFSPSLKAGEGKPIPFILKQQKIEPIAVSSLLKAVEEDILKQTNHFRAKKNLSVLTSYKTLSEVARKHSQDMLRRGYISHYSPEGLSALDRIRKVKPDYEESCGENLHEIFSSQGLHDSEAIATQMMKDWIHSPDHLKNLISQDFALLGVGCASNGFKIYCTQLFSGPHF